VAGGKFERAPGCSLFLPGRAEEQIDVGGNPRLGEGLQSPSCLFHFHPFFHPLQNPVISRFKSDFQHGASRLLQAMAKVRFHQLRRDPDKTVPGGSGRLVDERLEERRTDGVVGEVDQGGPVQGCQSAQIGEHLPHRARLIAVPLRRLRTVGAAVPVAAAGGVVGENGARGQVFRPLGGGIGDEGAGGRGKNPVEFEQGSFARAIDKMVDEPGEGIAPIRPAHPRSDQSPAEDNPQAGMIAAQHSDQREGGQGLAEVGE